MLSTNGIALRGRSSLSLPEIFNTCLIILWMLKHMHQNSAVHTIHRSVFRAWRSLQKKTASLCLHQSSTTEKMDWRGSRAAGQLTIHCWPKLKLLCDKLSKGFEDCFCEFFLARWATNLAQHITHQFLGMMPALALRNSYHTDTLEGYMLSCSKHHIVPDGVPKNNPVVHHLNTNLKHLSACSVEPRSFHNSKMCSDQTQTVQSKIGDCRTIFLKFHVNWCT